MVVPGCVTREWIEERKIEWGEESPLYKAKVLGEFPDEGTDTLFPLSVVQSSVNREVPFTEIINYGSDVARYGDDETTIFKGQGYRFTLEKVMSKSATTDVSGYLMGKSKQEYHIHNVAVDDTENPPFNVLAINFGAASSDPEMFFNLKAELFWKMSLDFKAEKMSIEDDPVLISQLTSIRYFFTPKGQIRIESKDDMKKRGLKSPDRADGLAICYSTKINSSGKLESIYSPGLSAGVRDKIF